MRLLLIRINLHVAIWHFWWCEEIWLCCFILEGKNSVISHSFYKNWFQFKTNYQFNHFQKKKKMKSFTFRHRKRWVIFKIIKHFLLLHICIALYLQSIGVSQKIDNKLRLFLSKPKNDTFFKKFCQQKTFTKCNKHWLLFWNSNCGNIIEFYCLKD